MTLRVRQREKEEMLYTQLKELQERVSFADAARALTELYGVYIWSFYISLRPFLPLYHRPEHKCVCVVVH
jgi:hypothetical protein